MEIEVDVGPNRGSQQKKNINKKIKKNKKKVDKRSWELTGDMNSKTWNMLKVLNHLCYFFQ